MKRTDLVENIFRKGSFLCVGLDPDVKKLPECLQGSPAERVLAFNKAIIDATAPYCVAYKPNLAFFECLGAEGLAVLDETVKYIRAKYPDQPLMADCATLEEMRHADDLGFDFIGTTLVGYTSESEGDKIETNDFEIIRELLKTAKHPVIGEGNIDTPEKVKRVLDLGAYSVVVGSIITRPQVITRRFVEAIED